MDPEHSDPDLQVIESIYDALDRQDAERALELARLAMQVEAQADPVVAFLAGVALLELDRPEDAAAELRRALELDPDETEFRANLALALFRCCRFDEADEASTLAVESDPALPDAQHVRALLLERSGRTAEADQAFAQAQKLDPDAFPAPRRLSLEAFESEITQAAARLPETFREQLDRVAVSVEPLPSDAILQAEEPPLDPELLGLFVGTPLTECSAFSAGGELPPRILLFQRNLERCFSGPDELRQEIARTLYHELGHYLGLDEDQLTAIDLG